MIWVGEREEKNEWERWKWRGIYI